MINAALNKVTIKVTINSKLRTGSSVDQALGCHEAGCEFDSSQTNNRCPKIIEEKVLPL